MRRSSVYTIIVFGVAIVVATVGFFLLGIERIAIHFWALGFLVLSLLISMVSIVEITRHRSSKDALFNAAGTVALVWLYQIAVIASVVLVGVFDGKTGIFIFVEFVILAAFAIIALAVNLFARHVHASNAKTLERKVSGEYDSPKRGGF